LKGASSDGSKIRGWWAKWPDANIGVATGPGSGIFVLDVDGKQGQASLEAMEPLPETLRANTGRTGAHGERTGFHLFFASPGGVNLRSSAGRLGKGLDIKASGGYVVAPPSLHASGLRYEWADKASTIAGAPAWLIAAATEDDSQWTQVSGTHFLYEGDRDVRLYRLAGKWRREGASQDEIYVRLRAVNLRICKDPLEERQVLKIARSAARTPVGSPDPLDVAWENVKVEGHWYAYDKLLSLIRHLESQRPGCSILLPVVRIGKLIGCDRTLVGRHRKRAIADGYIQEVEKYIAHEKATRFKVLRLPPNMLSH
jgi:putative DNA primase/helicase